MYYKDHIYIFGGTYQPLEGNWFDSDWILDYDLKHNSWDHINNTIIRGVGSRTVMAYNDGFIYIIGKTTRLVELFNANDNTIKNDSYLLISTSNPAIQFMPYQQRIFIFGTGTSQKSNIIIQPTSPPTKSTGSPTKSPTKSTGSPTKSPTKFIIKLDEEDIIIGSSCVGLICLCLCLCFVCYWCRLYRKKRLNNDNMNNDGLL
eukprot:UN12014